MGHHRVIGGGKRRPRQVEIAADDRNRQQDERAREMHHRGERERVHVRRTLGGDIDVGDGIGERRQQSREHPAGHFGRRQALARQQDQQRSGKPNRRAEPASRTRPFKSGNPGEAPRRQRGQRHQDRHHAHRQMADDGDDVDVWHRDADHARHGVKSQMGGRERRRVAACPRNGEENRAGADRLPHRVGERRKAAKRADLGERKSESPVGAEHGQQEQRNPQCRAMRWTWRRRRRNRIGHQASTLERPRASRQRRRYNRAGQCRASKLARQAP